MSVKTTGAGRDSYILACAGVKGGVGKSTAAINLAVCVQQRFDRPVLLVDANTAQGSASEWCNERILSELPPIERVLMQGNIKDALHRFRQKYPVIIVDVGGYNGPELQSSLLAADQLLSPIRPAQFDVGTLDYMNRLVAEVRVYNPSLKATVLINQASTHPQDTNTRRAAEAVAQQPELTLAETVWRMRKLYTTCAEVGAGVIEMASQKKSEQAGADEVLALADELLPFARRGTESVSATVLPLRN